MSTNNYNQSEKKTNEGKYVYKTELLRIIEKQHQQQNKTPKKKKRSHGPKMHLSKERKEIVNSSVSGRSNICKLKQRDIILNCQRGSLNTIPQNSQSALLVEDINWINHSGTPLGSIYQKASFIQQRFYIYL